MFTLWGCPKEARIAANMVLGLYLESMLLLELLWELSWAPLGALRGPIWGAERALKMFWGHLGPT